MALRTEWEQRIAAFRASGQSTTAWCESHEVKPHQFRYWLRQFPVSSYPAASSSAKVEWLSVRPDASPSFVDTDLVVHIGRARVDIKQGCHPQLLTQVLQTLVTLC